MTTEEIDQLERLVAFHTIHNWLSVEMISAVKSALTLAKENNQLRARCEVLSEGFRAYDVYGPPYALSDAAKRAIEAARRELEKDLNASSPCTD